MADGKASGGKHCGACGASLEPGARFCAECGASTSADAATGSAPGKQAGVLAALLAPERRRLVVGGAIAALILIVVLIVVSGGGDDPNVAAPRRSRPVKSTTSTEPPTTTTTLPPGSSWEVSGSDDRGYSQKMTITFGPPKPARPNATTSDYDFDAGRTRSEKLIKSCIANKATDAMVKVTVRRENTTPEFPELLGALLSQAELNDSIRVASDVEFTGGPTCTEPFSAGDRLYGAITSDPVEPGDYTENSFFLIIYNYYSPLNPAGDVANYGSLRLEVQLTFGPDSDDRIVDDVVILSAGASSSPGPQLVTP
jgi:hypothetical protein